MAEEERDEARDDEAGAGCADKAKAGEGFAGLGGAGKAQAEGGQPGRDGADEAEPAGSAKEKGGIAGFLARKDVEISFQRYAVDALSAMAQGLFASLLIGTIFNTLGTLSGVSAFNGIGAFAIVVAGPAMAVAIGHALKSPPLVLYSLVVVGYAANSAGGAGGPLAVLVVAIIAAELGKMVSKETQVDILVTPAVTVGLGCALAILVGPAIGAVATGIGNFIMWATELQPLLMGILVSVVVGVALTLPISSAAICAALGIVLKVTMVVQLILVGFSFGGVPLFGFLYGAREREKLNRLLRFCTLFLCGLALAESLLVFLLATPLMRVFIDNAAIVADGAVMLRWQIAGMVFCAVVLLYTCLFQASGKALQALAMSLSRQGVLFVAVFLVATAIAGYRGFLAAQLVADGLSAALALVLYRGAFAPQAG